MQKKRKIFPKNSIKLIMYKLIKTFQQKPQIFPVFFLFKQANPCLTQTLSLLSASPKQGSPKIIVEISGKCSGRAPKVSGRFVRLRNMNIFAKTDDL
jgi:hypothetical protein